jgi:colanic acid/amylovoran biosynthesis glycosyltransferase
MRIAYLVNQYPKVSHTFVRREILALEARGVQVERFSIRDTHGEIRDDEDAIEATRTTVLMPNSTPEAAGVLLAALARVAPASPLRMAEASQLALTLGARALRPAAAAAYLGEAATLLRWCKARQVDHVHAHFGTNSAAVAALCEAMGGPSFSFTVHGPEEFDKPFAFGIDIKIQRARFVAGVSSFGRAQLIRHGGPGASEKVIVVPCGLDEAYLGDLELPPVTSARKLCCIGRLCAQKGQLTLLDAAAEVKRRIGTFELVLVGDGEMRPDVEQRIGELGLGDTVRITGWATGDEVKRELLGARAMVLPSYAEGLPVALMEALALERPVISTFIAGIPELVDDRCGWILPAGAVPELVEAMVAALTADPANLRALGAEGRRRVVARHDARVAAQLLERAFRRALGR